MEVAVAVHETWNLVLWSHRAPAVVDAFARQREVKTEINFRMRLGIFGDLWKPRARHHNAGGVDAASLESFDRSRIHGMSHAHVVGVHDQKLGIARKSELFKERFRIVLRTYSGRPANVE